MNGVINIITRRAQQTTGGLLRASAGDQNRR
jgi:outer membrane receptor for ferrienterochelin and colicin